jgi:hypothetical protein
MGSDHYCLAVKEVMSFADIIDLGGFSYGRIVGRPFTSQRTAEADLFAPSHRNGRCFTIENLVRWIGRHDCNADVECGMAVVANRQTKLRFLVHKNWPWLR